MSSSSPLVVRARALAREAHAGQVRKHGSIEYFVHLEAVVAILLEHGYDDPVTLAAAYLHDLIEDQPAYVERLRHVMPPDVVTTVEALTERKLDDDGEMRSKAQRFADYLEGLWSGGEAARRAIPVSCADKIHNVRSLVEAEREGVDPLGSLSTPIGAHEVQLESLRELYATVVRPSLLATFDVAKDELIEITRARLLARAVQIASEGHAGQTDKAGRPYIEHPLRLSDAATSAETKIVAVLHDVIEDTEWTLDALRREGFPPRVVCAIDRLTRRETESYDEFITRVAGDRLAIEVKLLDLEDNADLGRLPVVTDRDRDRAAKYQRAIARLRGELDKRHLYVVLDEASVSEVRARAVHRVLRGDHVTLTSWENPTSFDPAWVPGGAKPGDRVQVHAVGEAADERVQALRVEIAGTSRRPYDGGILHVTVSRAHEARSVESNRLLAQRPTQPIDLELRGTVQWVDR
jgi:hypothetical protein